MDQNGQVHNLGVRTLTFSKANATIHLYPNPTRDNLVVKFPADTYTTLELWNAAGRRLNGINIAAGVNQLQMDLASYPAGIYLMKLSGKGGSFTQKIIRQ